MDKVKEQQDNVVSNGEEIKWEGPGRGEVDRPKSGPGIRSQRDLEEELGRKDVVIKQQTEALQHAEQEIIRLRAELYEYYRQVIQNQHNQIQELSSG